MAQTDHRHDDHHEQAHGGGVGTHGMLVIGTDPVFLSHLPMFHRPHNFQVLLEAALKKAGTNAVRRYLDDRASSGQTLYTLEPEQFALTDLLSDFPDPPKRTSFKGTLYRGHFERGGEPILDGVVAKVLDVTFFKELDGSAGGGKPGPLTYRCFGSPDQRFLAHEIGRRPSFDHILEMRFADPDVANMSFPDGPVHFGERKDVLRQRLRENETVVGFFFQTIGPQGQHGFSTDVVVGKELYLESDELKG